jgi:PAT family beta-lactamase induction signal transducer AmpG
MLGFHQYVSHKYGLLVTLYCTQFMGIGFIYTAVPAILRKEGVPLDQISAVYAIGLFWTIKFIWAPIIDRYTISGFGQYRGWIMLLQCLMVLALLLAAFFKMPADYSILLGVFALLAFFSSTQDIATDALTFTLLKERERGLGGAIQTAGAMLGNIIGSGLVLIVYSYIGWSGALVLLAVMTSFSLLYIYMTHHKITENIAVCVESIQFSRLWTFFANKQSLLWLTVIIIFYSGLSISYVLVNPMLVDFGWSLEKIGVVSSIFGSLFSIVGALLIGLIITTLGKKVAMLIAGVATLLATLGLLSSLYFVTNDWVLYLAVILIFIGYGAACTVVYMGMMDNSRAETPGTDFTLQFSVTFSCGFTAAGIGLSQAEQYGYSSVLWVGGGISVIALVSIYFYYSMIDRSLISNNKNLTEENIFIEKIQINNASLGNSHG